MKIRIIIFAAISFSLACASVAQDYDDLAAQGYRWITVNGPYACPTKQDLERITSHHTDETELRMVEDLEAYYLIPGTIARLVREDSVSGMSQLFLAGFTFPLWTYTRFLSKHPIEDTYGVIETPENSGLIPAEASGINQLPDQSQAMPSFSANPKQPASITNPQRLVSDALEFGHFELIKEVSILETDKIVQEEVAKAFRWARAWSRED